MAENTPAQGQSKGKSIACMACGIASIVLCEAYGMGLIPAIISLVLGSQCAKEGVQNTFTKVGKITGIIGLILSIGKWSRVSDIDDSDNLTLEDSRSIYTLVRQAKTNSSESDSAYFDELGKLISMLKKLCENKKKIDELKDELTTIKIRTKIINRVNQSYSEESNEMITKKLMDQIVPRQKEYNKLKTDFNNLRESVLSMRSDSVLAK